MSDTSVRLYRITTLRSGAVVTTDSVDELIDTAMDRYGSELEMTREEMKEELESPLVQKLLGIKLVFSENGDALRAAVRSAREHREEAKRAHGLAINLTARALQDPAYNVVDLLDDLDITGAVVCKWFKEAEWFTEEVRERVMRGAEDLKRRRAEDRERSAMVSRWQKKGLVASTEAVAS